MSTHGRSNSVFLAVPVGRENAVGRAKIEEILGVLGSKKIKFTLAELVAAGRIHAVTVPGFRRHDATVYFRPRA